MVRECDFFTLSWHSAFLAALGLCSVDWLKTSTGAATQKPGYSKGIMFHWAYIMVSYNYKQDINKRS